VEHKATLLCRLVVQLNSIRNVNNVDELLLTNLLSVLELRGGMGGFPPLGPAPAIVDPRLCSTKCNAGVNSAGPTFNNVVICTMHCGR